MDTNKEIIEVVESIKSLLSYAERQEIQGLDTIQLPLSLYKTILESYKENMYDLIGKDVVLKLCKEVLSKHNVEIHIS